VSGILFRIQLVNFQPRKQFVVKLWTEFAAQHGEALATNGKELQNP
jgi:hypothetical protein